MRIGILVLAAARLACAQTANLDSFEKVWSTIRDKHWEQKPGGLDWQKIHDEFRPRAERATSIEETRGILREMLGRLKQTHFGIVPSGIYAALDGAPGEGVTGIELRVLDGAAVVTGVETGSPGERAGVKPGWEIVAAGGVELGPLIAKAKGDPSIHEINLTRSLAARLTGSPGESVRVTFLDGGGKSVNLDLPLAIERGNLSVFGNMPPQRVRYDFHKLANSGYVRFNIFLDLVRLMGEFEKTIDTCRQCDGLIIDLRGNPGGIGGMAMGMAGYLIDQPDQKLGTMYMREATLKFVVNPRLNVFQGPVAILVDGCSASTSEIFAEGLKDLGRARIFGTHTAAAALPSIFERLPNGDGFQYAVANYISQGGQPLEGLGVTPDQEIKLTRQALLAGRDPVVEAAREWIGRQKGIKP